MPATVNWCIETPELLTCWQAPLEEISPDADWVTAVTPHRTSNLFGSLRAIPWGLAGCKVGVCCRSWYSVGEALEAYGDSLQAATVTNDVPGMAILSGDD